MFSTLKDYIKNQKEFYIEDDSWENTNEENIDSLKTQLTENLRDEYWSNLYHNYSHIFKLGLLENEILIQNYKGWCGLTNYRFYYNSEDQGLLSIPISKIIKYHDYTYSKSEEVELAIEHFKNRGEKFKNQDSINKIYNHLLKNKFSRDSCLVAFGGGVIGDTTGYASATYQRGINFIQIPTTLLSMVDSSVGGKTGINHELGKNMIGAFHQPIAVIIDTENLKTLSIKQFNAGMAEVIKYGIIKDKKFFDWIEKNTDKIKEHDTQSLIKIIKRSCEIKSEIVAQD